MGRVKKEEACFNQQLYTNVSPTLLYCDCCVNWMRETYRYCEFVMMNRCR